MITNSIAIGYDTEPTASNQIMFGNAQTTELVPSSDNITTLGSSTHRWTTVYATNGTINTSDITQKTHITLHFSFGQWGGNNDSIDDPKMFLIPILFSLIAMVPNNAKQHQLGK